MWGAASIIYDALHLKTTACLSLPRSLPLSLSLSPLIPIVTTSPGSICLYGGTRQRPVGWFGTSRLLMGVNKQEVQLRQSLNYQNVILNKHLRWLMGRVFTAADTGYRWRQLFSQLSFCFFVSTGLFSDRSSCHISIYSTSNVPSLVRSFLSSCRSISLKGSSFILTYDVLRCHKLRIHTELKKQSSPQCLTYSDMKNI